MAEPGPATMSHLVGIMFAMTSRRVLVPLAEAVAPARARHHGFLPDLAPMAVSNAVWRVRIPYLDEPRDTWSPPEDDDEWGDPSTEATVVSFRRRTRLRGGSGI